MENKMKIIFLDIDGVLNGYGFWSMFAYQVFTKLNLRKWYLKHRRDPFGVHEEKVRRLAKIVKQTNAKVVMSSSWRYGWWNTPYDKQFEDQRQLTDLLNKYNIEVIDITGSSPDGRRDEEIMAWLREHRDEVYSFVILDDERYDLECFGLRLVQTSATKKGEMISGHWRDSTGLKHRHINMAINVLNVEWEKWKRLEEQGRLIILPEE